MDQTSPFRSAPLACPRCRTTQLARGTLRACPACRGTWIPDEALHERIGQMQAAHPPWLDWRPNENRRGLPCAACTQPMQALLLFHAPVDRCHAHGIWFDVGELAEVLHKSAVARAEDPPSRAAVAGAVGGDAATTGVEVAACGTADLGALEVAGGILEAIGTLFSIIDL